MEPTPSFDAVILAGGVNSGDLKRYAPYENEALIVIGSYPMIYYVYRALRETPAVRRVVISGPQESLGEIFKHEKDVLFAPPGGDAVESFSNALEVLQREGVTEQVLVVPADIPFITPEAISDFLARCQEVEADFHYAIVPRAVNDSRFPGVKRTYVSIKEGVFTGGNLFLLRASSVAGCLDMARKIVAHRKNPLALARLFGLGLAWRYVAGTLSIADVEKRFAEVMRIRGRAVVSPYAEVGVDVDKPSDLQLAESLLGRVQKPPERAGR